MGRTYRYDENFQESISLQPSATCLLLCGFHGHTIKTVEEHQHWDHELGKRYNGLTKVLDLHETTI
jgi:hypothetical protein